MENTKMNPLIQYNKRPARYIKLPSGGQCYSKPIDLSDSGEIAVYPMTAKDEILLKSPDALLNGEALKQVFRTCVPGIPDPNEVPAIDIDAIMVGIRMSTYGDFMETEFVCPDCVPAVKNPVNVNLGNLLDTTVFYTGSKMVELSSGIKVTVKPYTLSAQNKVSIAGFEEMAKGQQIEKDVQDQLQKIRFAGGSFTRLLDATLDLISSAVEKVETPDRQEFNDRTMIREWLTTISKPEFDLIDKTLKSLMDAGVDTTIKFTCSSCKVEHTTDLPMNPSDFFA